MEHCEDAAVAERHIDLLVTAVSQVGIAAIALLTRTGRWPPCATLLLHGLCAMADAGPRPPHRRPLPLDAFFLLDGGGGLLLGADPAWPFEQGYIGLQIQQQVTSYRCMK